MTLIKHYIKNISVQKLFGTYDYNLGHTNEDETIDNIFILYGDNGSGKTTILRCLFHLLAPQLYQSHKTAVAQIPFKRFDIEFSTGDRVWAERTGDSLIGSFTTTILFSDGSSRSIEFHTDTDLLVVFKNAEEEAKGREYHSELSRLNLALFFLSDDRTVKLAGNIDEVFESHINPNDDLEIDSRDRIVSRGIQRTHISSRSLNPTEILLNNSLQRANAWIRTQVIKGSSAGESSVQSLYSEVLQRLATRQTAEPLPLESRLNALRTRISQLETLSAEYARFGLHPIFKGKDILGTLELSTSPNIEVINNVLTPYLDSIERKLNALERTFREIHSFVSIINGFFSHKSIRFHMHRGFDIITESGGTLHPSKLSSGERHLFLLFLNTITAFERDSLFIIDEPEISLNVKWQRQLISSLLDCVGDNAVQYLIATHSLELLAQHKQHAHRLA